MYICICTYLCYMHPFLYIIYVSIFVFWDICHRLIYILIYTLGIQSPSENGNGTRIPPWGGDYTPQSSSDKVIESLGIYIYIYIFVFAPRSHLPTADRHLCCLTVFIAAPICPSFVLLGWKSIFLDFFHAPRDMGSPKKLAALVLNTTKSTQNAEHTTYPPGSN